MCAAKKRKWFTKLAQATCLGAIAGFTWGWWEARWFKLKRETLRVLPAGASPIRVLHISDIHLMSRQKRKRRFVAALAGLEPDLVINTGDNLAQAEALDDLVAALGRLLDKPGAFVFGSNDYYSPRFKNPLKYLFWNSQPDPPRPRDLPFERMRDIFVNRGWVDLTNQRQQMQMGDLAIEFRGTDDAHLNLDDYAQVAGPAAEGTFPIGVTHAPYLKVLDAMCADVPLIFAGHTHGGQVCVPFMGALITNCDLPTEKAQGSFIHTHDGRSAWVHVSAGIGTSPFAAYRFACRPSATLITLEPKHS